MDTAPDNSPGLSGAPHGDPDGAQEWQQLRGSVRHQTVGMLGEIFALLRILLQDAIILVVGFAVEFAFERWLHTEQPFFRFAINISSAMFLLLYGVMVTVHVVHYVQEQFGTVAANITGNWIPWGLAAAGVIAAVIAMNRPGVHSDAVGAPSQRISRLTITLPPGDRLAQMEYPALAISSDGRNLVYAAIHDGVQQLYLRPLDSLEARVLSGTEGGNTPFFSPDNQWIGFSAHGTLKKLSLGRFSRDARGGSVRCSVRCNLGDNGNNSCPDSHCGRHAVVSGWRRASQSAANSGFAKRGTERALASFSPWRQCNLIYRRSKYGQLD